MTQIPFSLPEYNPEVLDFLSSRRSNLAKNMSGPGPDADTLEKIMAIGARVPDHRKLAPWRFIVFEGTARESIGAHLGKVFKANNPDMPEDRVSFEAQRFLRAPVDPYRIGPDRAGTDFRVHLYWNRKRSFAAATQARAFQ